MTLPVISIVGRPNVGKSTLFNRIIQRREAIVDDAPGITRDRKYAKAEWEGKEFYLVDTGGYCLNSTDVIESGVSRQVRFAIDESDLILFVVDSKTGITDVDAEVARLLRKGGKPCIVIVNKVDTVNYEPYAAEFIKIGLGEPVPISALEGRNIGDMLSSILSRIENRGFLNEQEDNGKIKLAIVGKPNVGKSTFINKILGEERLLVTDVPGTTRDAVDVAVTLDGKNFLLVDTAGLRRRTKVYDQIEYYSNVRTHRIIETCDTACVFVNANEGLAQQDMRIIKEVVDARKGIVIVFNKFDLIKSDREKVQELKDEIEMKLRGLTYIPTLNISCITGFRVIKVLEKAYDIAMERSKRISSSKLNKYIEELNRHYQPPAVRGKRVRILYAAQVGHSPPKIAFFASHPDLLQESYKRFLENRIRSQFGFEGVPISFIFRKK